MIKKTIHLLQRLKIGSREFPCNRKEFGITVASALFIDYLLPRGKSQRYISTLSKYVEAELEPLISHYHETASLSPNTKLNLGDKTPVWVFWWQGYNSMPPLVRACIHRMESVLPTDRFQIHIVTADNMSTYIHLPSSVIKKHTEGVITIQALSDILRYALMSTYGGFWIDSTVYLTTDILTPNDNQLYYTQRFDDSAECPHEACRGKWCNFFFGGRAENELFAYVYDALIHWWNNHTKIVDYVIVDYIIWSAYCNLPRIRKTIDAVPANNKKIWYLSAHLNDPYDPQNYDIIMQQNGFFKLSYKGNLVETLPDGRKTIYGHLLEENKVFKEG